MTMQRIQRQPPGGYRSTWVAPRVGRGERVLLVLAGVASWLAMPVPASAACGPRDLTTCVNAAQFAFWQGVAGALWSVNRVLLTLTYQLDVLRAWLVETVFTAVFQIVTEAISPTLAPIATIAVLIGVLCFLVMPVIGRVEIVNIRRALIWIVVAPILLAVAGQGLAGAEQLRTTMGQTMFAAAQEIGSAPRFGAQSGEMNASASPLYPFFGCDGGALDRPFIDGGSEAGIFMDDLAAAMMYADAEDIHCPLEGSGPGTELPDGFYSPAGGGAGGSDYATTRSVSDMDASESAEWVRKIQQGVTRLLMGVVPSLLAVMNAIIQLLFALALVLLFIALPLGLLLVFFTDTAAGVTGLARRMVSVLQTSWSSSLLLGIVFVALLAASALGNVAAFVGLSVAGILLTLFIIFIAVNAFMSSVQAVAQTVSLGTGITGSAAKVALAGATGGVGAVAMAGAQATKAAGEMGLDYAVARRAGTSRRYALGTAAGRIRGVARVGGLAAALGMGNEVTDGIYTGERGARSRESYRLTHRLASADAAKKDANQQTMREREQERDLQRTVERAWRGSTLEEAGRIIGGGMRTVRHPVKTAHHAVRAAGPSVERISELSGDLAHAAWERARAARDSVVERTGDKPTVMDMAAAVVAAGSHGFTRDARSGRMTSNGRGGVTFLPRLPVAELPAHALRERVADVHAGRLLQLGHHLQYNPDGTVTFWRPGGPAEEQGQTGHNVAVTPTARGPLQGTHTTSAASRARVPASSTAAPGGAGAARGTVSASPATSTAPVDTQQPGSLGTTSSGSTTGGASRVSPSPSPARRTRVYTVPGTLSSPSPVPPQRARTATSGAAPVASGGGRGQRALRRPSLRIAWARAHRYRVQTARQALLNAQTRLLLVRQRAVAGPEDAAQQAVAAAAEQVVIVERSGRRLHPPLKRGSPRLLPAQRRAALERQAHRRQMRRHIHGAGPVVAPTPVEALVEDAARHNQAVAVTADGTLVMAPNDAPPGLRLELPVTAVRDMNRLLQAGYRVYQSPRGDTVSIWPARDAPDVHWLEAGTPRARPDLPREQRRLERQGLITPTDGVTSAWSRPRSVLAGRRRRTGPRRRTLP